VKGVVNGLATLSVESDVTLTDGGPSGNEYRVSADGVSRSVAFDVNSGKVRSMLEECHMTGTVTERLLAVGEVALPVKLSREVRIRVTDEKPKAKK
jgi:hypothetical protein